MQNRKKTSDHKTSIPLPYSPVLPHPYFIFPFPLFPSNFHILALWLSLPVLTAWHLCLAVLYLKHVGSIGDGELIGNVLVLV